MACELLQLLHCSFTINSLLISLMNNQRQIWNNALNGNSKGAFSLLSSIRGDSCDLACTSAWVLLLEGSDGDAEPEGGIAHIQEVSYYPTCLYWLIPHMPVLAGYH